MASTIEYPEESGLYYWDFNSTEWHAKATYGYAWYSNESLDNAIRICWVIEYDSIYGDAGTDGSGWTLESLCGMLGNMSAMESGLNPWRQQNEVLRSSDYEGENGAYGLAQFDRRTKYTKSAEAQKLDGFSPYCSDTIDTATVYDGRAQSYFIARNMAGQWSTTGSYASSYGATPSLAWEEYTRGFYGTKLADGTWYNTPEQAAVEWCSHYERPSYSASGVNTRQVYARHFYNLFSGIDEGGYNPDGAVLILNPVVPETQFYPYGDYDPDKEEPPIEDIPETAKTKKMPVWLQNYKRPLRSIIY